MPSTHQFNWQASLQILWDLYRGEGTCITSHLTWNVHPQEISLQVLLIDFVTYNPSIASLSRSIYIISHSTICFCYMRLAFFCSDGNIFYTLCLLLYEISYWSTYRPAFLAFSNWNVYTLTLSILLISAKISLLANDDILAYHTWINIVSD